MRAELRAAGDQIAARDRLLTVAAHELLSPVSGLLLQTDVLATLLETPVENALQIEQALEMMQDQGQLLADLIRKLLDVGSLGAGHLRLSLDPTDLSAIVRDVLNRAEPSIQHSHCRLTLELQPAPGRWDRLRLTQVVTNLLSNALKYGRGEPILVRVTSEAEVAHLIVEDRGGGIPVGDRARVLRAYERIPQAIGTPGLGLGLYISAQIVAAHGGAMRIEGDPDTGARVIVDLPCNPAR
jgi:signal transduction histidine kinase